MAVRALSSGGIVAQATVASADSRVSTSQTNLWAMTGVSQKASIRKTLTVEMASGPAADFIRERGLPVYVFVRPQMIEYRRHASGREQVLPRHFFLAERQYNCRGYAVILSPQNGYRATQSGVMPWEIRSQTSLSLGYLSGGENWSMARIDAHAPVEQVSLQPFKLPRYSQARSPFESPCYMDGMRDRWR